MRYLGKNEQVLSKKNRVRGLRGTLLPELHTHLRRERSLRKQAPEKSHYFTFKLRASSSRLSS